MGSRGSRSGRDTIANGVRITYDNGSSKVYKRGPNGRIVDERGLPVESLNNMKYDDFIRRVQANQKNSGVSIERMSRQDLDGMEKRWREERANRPDYEMGVGVPWGNKENRKAARQSRLAGRAARRK